MNNNENDNYEFTCPDWLTELIESHNNDKYISIKAEDWYGNKYKGLDIDPWSTIGENFYTAVNNLSEGTLFSGAIAEFANDWKFVSFYKGSHSDGMDMHSFTIEKTIRAETFNIDDYK